MIHNSVTTVMSIVVISNKLFKVAVHVKGSYQLSLCVDYYRAFCQKQCNNKDNGMNRNRQNSTAWQYLNSYLQMFTLSDSTCGVEIMEWFFYLVFDRLRLCNILHFLFWNMIQKIILLTVICCCIGIILITTHIIDALLTPFQWIAVRLTLLWEKKASH